ncbi:type IV pilus biogenesis/stability protein PilW [Chitinimonas koreensis]|uniref:type IV pilus biogenesis/stability protein PilW n=1 Tax=Chitinimonas koreensis TaxID=356302 RepID=UPI00041E0BB0|nr:type IV pilus biogenesis/stability protein PilW [Chitinimonas koreensis]QNM95604.1 type IV pilus biogenesis/stability protein PilW [Chitinimonas koreensis]
MKSGLIAFVVFVSFVMAGVAVRAEDADRRQEVVKLRTELAAAYYARAQYGVALEEIRNALALRNDYALAYNVQGLIYMDLREFDTADRSFRRALELDPSDSDTNHNYGWFLCNKLNRAADSIRYFVAAIRNPLYSTPEKSLQQAGLCALKAGDFVTADDFLKKADRALPDNPQTLYGLARLAFRRGELESARTLLSRQARLTSPTAESVWLNLRIERRLGNAENEAGFAKELRNRFPDSDEARALAAGQFD